MTQAASSLNLLNSLILATLLCWSVWGIFDKKALDAAGSHEPVILRMYLLTLLEIPLVAVLIAISEPQIQIAAGAWSYTFVGALISLVSVFAYLEAMHMAEASFVLAITASYPLVTQLLAVPLLHESLVGARLLGAAAIGFGVTLIGSSHALRSDGLKGRKKLKLFVLVVIATVCWGAWGIYDKKALAYATPLKVWLAQSIWEVALFLLAAAVMYAGGKRAEIKNGRAWLYAGLSNISVSFGRYTFLMAMGFASASYVITICGSYPLVMYLLAVCFLKEKFSKIRFAGILFVVAGGVAVQGTQGL
jgi:drug/metabolite transporter (DMT)-like permease